MSDDVQGAVGFFIEEARGLAFSATEVGSELGYEEDTREDGIGGLVAGAIERQKRTTDGRERASISRGEAEIPDVLSLLKSHLGTGGQLVQSEEPLGTIRLDALPDAGPGAQDEAMTVARAVQVFAEIDEGYAHKRGCNPEARERFLLTLAEMAADRVVPTGQANRDRVLEALARALVDEAQAATAGNGDGKE